MASAPTDLAPLLAAAAHRHDVPPAALIAMVGDIVKAGPSGGAALPELIERKAAQFAALRTRLGRKASAAEAQSLRTGAGEALEAGRFADADRLIAQLERQLLGEDLADLAALPAERRIAAGEARADRAAISALRVGGGTYREAAQRYGEASALMGLVDLARSRELALAQVETLVQISQDVGGRAGLDAAIAQARRLVEGISAADEPVALAAAQSALAEPLLRLAEMTGEHELYATALALCRSALEDVNRKGQPELWRRLQGQRGTLALRVGEARDDETLLEEAVTALAGALSAWDKARHGTGWLELEHHIAKARALLGSKYSDLALLERAYNSYNRIVMAIDRAREPLRWAGLQDDMGSVLTAMGDRYAEPVVLEEAVAAFAAALEERRRETTPLLWAQSTGNQACATMRLAGRRKDAGLAQAAVQQMTVAIAAMQAAGRKGDADALKRRFAQAEVALRS